MEIPQLLFVLSLFLNEKTLVLRLCNIKEKSEVLGFKAIITGTYNNNAPWRQ